MKIAKYILCLVLLAVGMPAAAQRATWTVFTDLAEFQAAAPDAVLYDFQPLRPAGLDRNTPAWLGQSFDYQGLNFRSFIEDDEFRVVAPRRRDPHAYLATPSVGETDFLTGEFYLLSEIVITPANPIRSFGFTFLDHGQLESPFRVSTNTRLSSRFVVPDAETPYFWGFVTDTDISQFAVQAQGNLRILNFYSQPAQAGPAVPEPATWAMMLLGCGAVGLMLRRRGPVRVTA